MFNFKRLALGIILVFSGQNSLNSSEAAVMRIVASGLKVMGLYLARPEVAWPILHNQKTNDQNQLTCLSTILLDKNSPEYAQVVEIAKQSLINKALSSNNFKITIDNDVQHSQLASVTFSMPISSSFYNQKPSTNFIDYSTIRVSNAINLSSRNLGVQIGQQLPGARDRQHDSADRPNIEAVIGQKNETVLNHLKTCDKQELLVHLSKPENFIKLLIQSNSVNEHDRIYARRMLPYLLEFGPQYDTTYSSLAAIIRCYYNDEGQLQTTAIVPEASDKIIYCLKQFLLMGNSLEYRQLSYRAINEPLIKDLTYLRNNFDGLINKAKELGLYDIDQILETYKSNDKEMSSIGKSYINIFCTQSHGRVDQVIVNKDNFAIAETLNDLKNAFDINISSDLSRAKQIYIQNANNPAIVGYYDALEKYYRKQFEAANFFFANDPVVRRMKPQLNVMRSDFEKLYQFYHFIYRRNQLKNKFLSLFAIQKTSDQIDQVIFKIIDCANSPNKYLQVLSGIAKNKDKDLLSQELYKAFYFPNGILKCYWQNPFARQFKLNPSLPKNIQEEISLCANKLLGYKSKSAIEKQVVDACVKLLEVANKNVQSEPYLRVAQCSMQALNGNKDYGFILCKPSALKYPQGAIEVYNQIQEVQKAKTINLQEPTDREKTKIIAPPTEQPVEQPIKKPKVESEEEIEIIIQDEEEIKKLIESEQDHIFSKDHTDRGIYNLSPDNDPNDNGNKEKEKESIKKEIIKLVKKANQKGLLKDSNQKNGITNQIQGHINGKKVEIRVNIKDGKPRSVTILPDAWSKGVLNNGHIVRFASIIPSKL